MLGIESPWRVEDVELNLGEGEVLVRVGHGGSALRCPECDVGSAGYDSRERRWRHLDTTMQYRTIVVGQIP